MDTSILKRPVGIKVPRLGAYSETASEQNLPPALWNSYLNLRRAYGRELMKLLRVGWNGPHGITGHFEFQGTYLGAA